MNYLFLLVILGQPNYTYKNFHVPPEHERRVKNIFVHPKYRAYPTEFSDKKPKQEQMPRFDFALIEVKKDMTLGHTRNYNFKFEPTVKPICLPSKRMWKDKFVEKIGKVSGYGRIEAYTIRGRDQNSMQLKEADLRITRSNDTKCEKVMFSYIIISELDCLVGRM